MLELLRNLSNRLTQLGRPWIHLSNNVEFSGSVCSEQTGNEAELGWNINDCGRSGAAEIRDLGFGYVTGQLPA